MQTAYEILGVGKDATHDEIRKAYRKLAKKLHPDLNPGNKDAEKKFKAINEAYEQIGTAEARAKYDRGETENAYTGPNAGFGTKPGGARYYYQTQGGPNGEQGRYSSSFGGMDEDLFESVFGGGGRASGFTRRAPIDENFQMEIDFKDSILGASKEIGLPNGKRLAIKIPPGIETGKKLRFAGEASTGGDILIEINVKPSTLFQRVGNHIEIEIPISISEALLGAEIRVPTLDGSILLRVPSGVSSGQKLRVAGKGVPAHGNEPAGDERVILKIVSPKTIDAEFKAAVQAWQARQPFHARGEGAAS